MKPDTFIPYTRQSVTLEDVEACSLALQADFITRGPQTEAFEKAIADYCGARYAVAFNSASSALLATCFAAKIVSYDRMITTPNSFIATIIGGLQRQISPIFVDIDQQTGNLDLALLQVNINLPATRGRDIIVPVHFAGIPVDMERVDAMIKNPDSVVIEDAAHALGSSYKNGQKVGSCAWSDMTVFSFHPSKAITTGEGGMVTTNDEELYQRLRLFRNNGIEREATTLQEVGPWYYEVEAATGNYHLTDIQSALGLSQLKRLDLMSEKRRNLVMRYRERLCDLSHLRWLHSSDECEIAYHLFVCQIDFSAYETTRKEVVQQLKEAGIGTQLHYIPLYRHPLLAKACGDISSYFPNMESYYEQALSLPLHCEMQEKEVDFIVETLKRILRKKP